jgi:hypothetical protein
VGAAAGGAAAVLLLIAIAARYRAVSIQINTTYSAKKWKHMPETEVNHNPLVVSSKLTETFPRKSKFEVVPV